MNDASDENKKHQKNIVSDAEINKIIKEIYENDNNIKKYKLKWTFIGVFIFCSLFWYFIYKIFFD